MINEWVAIMLIFYYKWLHFDYVQRYLLGPVRSIPAGPPTFYKDWCGCSLDYLVLNQIHHYHRNERHIKQYSGNFAVHSIHEPTLR